MPAEFPTKKEIVDNLGWWANWLKNVATYQEKAFWFQVLRDYQIHASDLENALASWDGENHR